jgi:hypothetical protein
MLIDPRDCEREHASTMMRALVAAALLFAALGPAHAGEMKESSRLPGGRKLPPNVYRTFDQPSIPEEWPYTWTRFRADVRNLITGSSTLQVPERSSVTEKAYASRAKIEKRSPLLSFYGNDCEMCEYMVPAIKRVEKELGVKVRRFETWSHPEHEKLRQLCDSRTGCGGVPFFYHKTTQRWICGATTYENLKNWAAGKPCAPFLPPSASFESQKAGEPQGAWKVLSDLRERGREAMEERQKLAEERRQLMTEQKGRR